MSHIKAKPTIDKKHEKYIFEKVPGKRSSHTFSEHFSSILIETLWKKYADRYSKPYIAGEHRRYDNNHREKKRAYARIIHTLTKELKKEEYTTIKSLLLGWFSQGIEPNMLTIEKRVKLYKNLDNFLRSRKKLYDIVQKYPEPVQLIKAIAPWLKRPCFQWDIQYVLDGMGLNIYCSNKNDYAKIAWEWSRFKIKTYQDTLWITRLAIKPNAISHLVKIFNGKKSNKTSAILIHENQHVINQIFLTSITSHRERAKDEILSFMKDGTSRRKILYLLTDKLWPYNYLTNSAWVPFKLKTYDTDFSIYFRDLYKYTAIAEQLKARKVPYYFELLMATPIHDWPKLRQYLVRNNYLSHEKN